MISKTKYTSKISIPCDCGSEIIEIEKFDDDYDIFYVNFKIDSFIANQNVFGVLKRRIKLAWLALKKGNYIHQEIVLNKDTLIELRDNINEILEDEDD